MAVDAGVAAQTVTLRLPPPECADGLRAAMPSYDLQDPSCALPPQPPAGLEGLAGLSSGAPLRMASLQSTGRCCWQPATLSADDVLLGGDFSPRSFSGDFSGGMGGSLSAADSDCASEDMFVGTLFGGGGGGLMPAIPASGYGSSASLYALSLPVLPLSLACIPAKTTGALVLLLI